MFPYLILKIETEEVWSHVGWTKDRRHAMRFPTEQDAREYFRSINNPTRINVIRPLNEIDDTRPESLRATTDYNPFGPSVS